MLRYIPDEMEGEVFGYPADFVVSRQLDDPLVKQEIEGLATEAELMGIDLDDPELMGAWLKNLAKKVQTAVKAGKVKSVSVQTSQGTAEVGKGGVSYTSSSPSKTMVDIPGVVSINKQSISSGIQNILKSPIAIAAGIGLIILTLGGKK